MEIKRNGLAWCVNIAKQCYNIGGEFLRESSLEKQSSGPSGYRHIEELIALVYSPSKEFHNFPSCEVTLTQKTTSSHGHQLNSMIFLGIIIRSRPGIFQASREEHYED